MGHWASELWHRSPEKPLSHTQAPLVHVPRPLQSLSWQKSHEAVGASHVSDVAGLSVASHELSGAVTSTKPPVQDTPRERVPSQSAEQVPHSETPQLKIWHGNRLQLAVVATAVAPAQSLSDAAFVPSPFLHTSVRVLTPEGPHDAEHVPQACGSQ